MSQEEKTEFILGLIFLAPLRIIVLTLSLLITTGLMVASVAGQDLKKPLPENVLAIQRKIGAYGSRVMCACFGIYSIKVKGKRSSPEECKMLILGPHSTVMDAFVLSPLGVGPAVAKGELESTPIIGSFMAANQALFVNRTDKNSRSKIAAALKERIARKSPWKRQVGIFPEGTCTNRSSLISFRAGAFRPGEPVQPVTLSWEFDTFDPSWTAGALSRGKIVLRSLTKWRQNVTVHFLPVYHPSEEEKQDDILYCENVRTLMAQDLGIPTSDFSNDDMWLAKIAAKKKLQPAFVLPFSLVELQRETQDLGIDKNELAEDAKTLLDRFGRAPKISEQGRMSQKMFEAVVAKAAKDIGLAQALEWDAVASKEREDGTITFHTFLIAHLRAKHSK